MRFDALKERLLEGGIAPRRVRRYLAELDDHLAELTMQERAAGYEGEDAGIRARTLLGSDNELAQSWLTDPRLKSLTARAPWAVIPGALILFLVLGFVMWIAPWLALGFGRRFLLDLRTVPDWFIHLSHLVSVASNFSAAPLAAVLLALLVRRQRLNVLWAVLPALILLVARVTVDVDSAPHSISVGTGFVLVSGPADLRGVPLPIPAIVVQAVLILAPSLWLLVRHHRRRAAVTGT